MDNAFKAELYKDPTNGLGSWIWAATVSDNQTVRLWKSFEVPAVSAITAVRLKLTADNEFTVYLDGREIGHGADYPELFVFDLRPLVRPGRHVLAVKAFNSYSFAGVILGLQVDFVDGHHLEVQSDQSWRVVPSDTRRWEAATEPGADWAAATIEAPLGGGPWWRKPQNICLMPTPLPLEIHFWQAGWFQIALLVLCSLAVLLSLRLMAQLALHKKERRLLQTERARITRDIHDDIGARMTQLVLHGEVAQSELPEDSEMRRQLNTICEEARGLLATMDEILWAVNPSRDTLRDFATYVCNYAEEFLKPTQTHCLFEVDLEMAAAALDLPHRRSLLMVIKEALNNAVKYSGATELLLKIQWQGERLMVTVQDNGKGFDSVTVRPERHGLKNMVQRMRELGGNCVVTTQPGEGCRIEVSLPLGQSRRHPLGWIWNPRQFSEQMNGKPLESNETAKTYDPTR